MHYTISITHNKTTTKHLCKSDYAVVQYLLMNLPGVVSNTALKSFEKQGELTHSKGKYKIIIERM